MEPLAAGQAIDAGAEEELFRRIGQQAAREALVRRWEQADLETEPGCRGCHQRMKGLGQRARQLRTLCGEVRIERRVYMVQAAGGPKRRWTGSWGWNRAV